MKYVCILLLFIGLSPAMGQAQFEKALQTQLILASDGDVIELEAGNFQISGSLSLEGKKKITIRGKGMDKTVLSFKDQKTGAEGIKITNCENIVLEDLTVQDSKGDLIKTMHVKDIIFRRIKAEWTGGPKASNGSYALYPVLCTNILIDSCIAIGASDAGIYVGQSQHIEVKNCTAYQNVAGIEIENSLYADVHHNHAYGNTGGILVFDLPDLIQKKGGFVKVHNNLIEENNLSNFAPKGNIVGKVPKGTGMLILATSHVDIYDNKILNHQTVGVGIISYFMAEIAIKDKEYDPYPTAISVFNNTFERHLGRVPLQGRFAQIYRFKLRFGRDVPHVVYDGVLDSARCGSDGNYLPQHKICVHHNVNQSVANMDAEHDFKNVRRNPTELDCVQEYVKSNQF
ncbi:parallel beta-helix domain-containing protein [Aquirufa regiilacus]